MNDLGTAQDLLAMCDNSAPNTELAIVLLASGQSHAFIRAQCGFDSVRAVQAFARDDDVRQAVKEQRSARVQRVSDAALVRLEQIVTTPHKDLRAEVLAIRTALDVGGALGRDNGLAVKSVADLSVSELNELIASTKSELNARLGEYRAHEASKGTKTLGPSVAYDRAPTDSHSVGQLAPRQAGKERAPDPRPPPRARD